MTRARSYGNLPAELSVRFLLADGHVAIVIVGAATVEQLTENVGSAIPDPHPPDIHSR